MKKIFLSLLLITIFILPVSAKMNADFILKGGILASPYLYFDGSNTQDVDLGFTLGGEIFAYPWKNIGLGLGAMHLFKTDIENTGQKISATNIYVAAKPKLVLENQEIDSVYLIGQLGLTNSDIELIDASGLSGIYAAAGIGIEAKWLIVEILYSFYNWAVTDNDDFSTAQLYSLQLNLGFKFSI